MPFIATIVVPFLLSAASRTPYTPTRGWTYIFEAQKRGCTSAFISSTTNDTRVVLGQAPDANAEFTLEASHSGDDAFYLKLSSNGKYLSYAGDCSNAVVDTWPAAGINQEFRLVGSSNSTFRRRLEAVGRASCGVGTGGAIVSFSSSSCSDDTLTMSAAGDEKNNTYFLLHVVRDNNAHRYDTPPNTGSCADPFAWHCPSCGNPYALACTGGQLELYSSTDIGPGAKFTANGVALGGPVPSWASSGARWAPENLEFTVPGGRAPHHVMFFSDATGKDGKHRVGWAMSAAGAGQHLSGSYTEYSSAPLDLGQTAQGEIDQHIFRDSLGDGATWLLWKTDDNSIGLKYTRIWAAPVSIAPGAVTLLSPGKEIMDSTGLWWIDSFIKGGSLIEGPELIHRPDLGFYYLFFAAGRYCTDSYSEGVARAKSIWGPWEKMPVPLLSTGLTGFSQGKKQVGPGHASFVGPTNDGGRYWAVYHASLGENCNRRAFVEELKWDPTSSWPYVAFGSTSTTR